MKKLLLILSLFSVNAFAAEEHEKQYVPLGCFQDTDMATAQALPSIPDGATRALWYVEDAPLRWRDDDTAPTASVGLQQPTGSEFIFFYAGVLGKVQIIEESTLTIFNVCYYK